MSEHSPDSPNGLADGSEPSMEDILASIRKIIADDDAGEFVSDTSEVEDAVGIDSLDSGLRDIPSENSDIDTLLSEIDMLESDLSVAGDSAEMLELTHDNMGDLEIPDESQSADSELDDLLKSIEDISEPENLEVDKPVIPETSIETTSSDVAVLDEAPDDDLSTMLDNMLNEGEAAATELEVSEDFENLELVLDPAADLLDDSSDLEAELLEDLNIEDDVLDADLSSGVMKPDSDIELVKSLMAELTGEPLHADEEIIEVAETETALETDDEIESEKDSVLESLVSDLSGDDISSETLELAEPTDDSAEDVMDEILSLTLDDELELQEDIPRVPDAVASLKEIAAQAEADAKDVESIFAKTLAAAAAGVAATAAVAQNDEEPEADDILSELDDIVDIVEEAPLEGDLQTSLSELDLDDLVEEEVLTSLADTNIQDLLDDEETGGTEDIVEGISYEAEIDVETTPQSDTETNKIIDEETTLMPRAAKSDAILDEVTETATADVFASLNKVVEEKATIAERGDRIGDLVQEALRPMLKEWLDTNLKGIVERAVTKEVKRISSGK